MAQVKECFNAGHRPPMESTRIQMLHCTTDSIHPQLLTQTTHGSTHHRLLTRNHLHGEQKERADQVPNEQ